MFAKCNYCRKRMTLRTKKNLFGKTVAANYVVVSEQNEDPMYMHKTCHLRYKRDKAKEKRKFGFSAGVGGFSAGYSQG